MPPAAQVTMGLRDKKAQRHNSKGAGGQAGWGAHQEAARSAGLGVARAARFNFMLGAAV
jgi:hypothetical protein